MSGVIVGMGRYCQGHEVDVAQSTLIKAFGTLTPDAVALVRAMHGRASSDPSDFLWVAVAGPSRRELESLGEVLDIPQLWIDDALNPRQRAKAEIAPDGRSALIVFKIVSYEEPTSSIETGQISLLVGSSFVVTVRLGPIGALARVRAAVTQRPEFLALGPMAAVHAIIDAIVDDYLEATDEIGHDIDGLEEQVFSPGVTDDSERIYLLKRENLELRRAVAPLVPVAHELVRGTLDGLPEPLHAHFHDVGDHLLRAHDTVDAHETLLMSMLQASNARQSLQQNQDMRKIAAYAAMLAWPTAVAGIYGMNFRRMPELDQVWGYPFALLLMGGGVFFIFRAFKRSGWL
jgi:magnesium transporter